MPNTSRRELLAVLGSAVAFAAAPVSLRAENKKEIAYSEEAPYTVADSPWSHLLGNHRAKVYVGEPNVAVWAHIKWRRADADPDQKAVLVYAPDGTEVLNAAAPNVYEDYGDVVFEAKQAGNYFIYYFPQMNARRSVLGPKGQYRKPEQQSEAGWQRQYAGAKDKLQSLPRAVLVEFQSRTALDSFYPMLVPATKDEVQELCARNSEAALIFVEDCEHPIQMSDRLPLRWVQRGTQELFSATVLRGETYVLQLGIYLREDHFAQDVSLDLRFEDLDGLDEGEKIPASAWTCVNTDIVSATGESTHTPVKAIPGKITALWCAVHVPLHAKPGRYQGKIVVRIGKSAEFPVAVELAVNKEFIRAGGVDQGWRLARIDWLNSKIGQEDKITAPYSPVQVDGQTVRCLGREVRFGDTGFPVSILSNQRELLAGPVTLSVNRDRTAWKGTSKVESINDAKAVLSSVGTSGLFKLDVTTVIEFDGGIGFDVKLSSRQTQSVSNIVLEIPYKKELAPYAVGMGLKGGERSRSWQWKWSQQPQRWKDQGSNLDFFLWMGDVAAGLYCKLSSLPGGWRNDENGSVSFSENGGRLLLRASCGSRKISAGEEVNLSFRLLPTPVKPLDPQRWKYRYSHAYQPPEELRELGATVNNIHQGTLPNMYINYPFLNLDLLTPYVSTAHELGMKIKIYYTMRELTTRLPELWTFRSLGHEIYRVGGTQGQGDPQLDFWLQEHLRDDYSAGWITLTPTGDIDTSLRVYSDSRLANFYLEGLNWLLKNVPIDGLYLDEIGYTRKTMQRVRRVLEGRPGAMIDMHGNDMWWSCQCPIGYYMEHLPYIDRLWLGEGFNPDSPPDFWLIEMSGIPFGLSSDMLEHPNPWRGMLFGMTNRALYTGPLPTPIWQLWDSFGIEDAEMIGWWDKEVPIKTGRQDVLATVYKKKDKSLIAIASWANQTTNVKLEFDWKALGLDEHRTKLVAHEMGYFQGAQKFDPRQSISVPSGKGYLLVTEQEDQIS
ncbi:hypothetical protein GCM10011507_09610 [Edaphobacter acidisoli]|uniref:Glycoside hydrolase 123-like N-terminal domain-containing protein n=1 Tax=Edaphobacter acidisoli TaxID=2040573 RepID=A0A916RKH8_9BACT|nr:glycoside hydrolase domain-containing protein [Edaphobacter acidisoli]GGA60110.1 hypothetical protein GCM10011507_09610 [Edaphobacter acidisoli]